MVETRCAPRFKVFKPAKVGDGKNAARCVIRDLSVTGAALEVESQKDIPDTFTLVVPEDNLMLPSRVVWRRGYRVGITFDDALSDDQPDERSDKEVA
jgi:hypothetical protein